MAIELRKEHICVCICTYKRPEMLLRLLSELEAQETGNLFEYSVLIVDNDKLRSAQEHVERYAKQSKLLIRYYVETEQNISLARNKTLENAVGDFVAMIDDDEYPSKQWLLALYKSFKAFGASGGVMGPVIPFYPEGTPKWLIRSKICERPNHSTGTELNWNMTRGGNVLLSREVLKHCPLKFDEKLGRNGGEDKDFFRRVIAQGYNFIWCSEAEVYEVVYERRWKLSHYLSRSLLNGGDAGKEHGKYSIFYLTKSMISLLCYSALLVCSVCFGKHYIYKYLIRVLYDFARIMGCFNVSFIRERHD